MTGERVRLTGISSMATRALMAELAKACAKPSDLGLDMQAAGGVGVAEREVEARAVFTGPIGRGRHATAASRGLLAFLASSATMAAERFQSMEPAG